MARNPSFAPFCDGDVVDLVATPRQGFIFDQWGGDCAFSGTNGQLTMDSDYDCTASFRQPTLTVVVTGGGGTVASNTTPALQCAQGGAGCQRPVANGLAVTLSALRAPGAPFLGWGGDCPNNAGLTSSLTISGDANCTASFGAAQPVGVNDGGGFTNAIVSLADDESLGDTGTSAVVNDCCGRVSMQLSADAALVAFASDAGNLVPGILPGCYLGLCPVHGFIRDRLNTTTERFNADPAQTPLSVPYGTSVVGLSADGRRALYDVGEQPTPPSFLSNSAVGLFDRRTNVHEKISVPDPVAGIGAYVGSAAISSNGRFAAFGAASGGGTGVAVRDTCFGAPPQDACTPHSVLISASGPLQRYPQLSADGRFAVFEEQLPSAARLLMQYDRDADGNGIFDEPGGTSSTPVDASVAFQPQHFSIDASGRYVAYIANGGATLRDTCMRAPPGCVPSSSRLDIRADGTPSSFAARAVHLSASARFAALLSGDPLLFGSSATPTGTFGVVRDTCLGAPAGCIPANNEVSVRQSDGGRGSAFNTGLAISQDGREAIITGRRVDYFGNTIPDAPDLFAAVTGFPLESGGTPTLSARSPGSAPAASPELYVTITGSGFVPGARVTVNGANRSTVFVSRAKLQALLDSADLAAPGVLMLRVANPGGGTSTPVSFVVN